ncbi:MAG: sodium:calcium antiporter [Planctomycetaceae bacterium]|nr:sodium:calcium antiporter [Planctomycetaceae bacterium]
MEHLIPHSWFTESSSLLLIVYAIGGLYFLQMGAEWLVEGASALAYRLGMPEVVVGATIVSLGTTTPECAVSVMAAFSGNSGLALGNAVGSVIADSALIFGLGCMMTVLPADRYILSRQGWVQLLSAVLLMALCYYSYALQGAAAAIERGHGLGLLVLLAVYMMVSIRWSRQHPDAITARVSENIAEHAEPDQQVHVADEHVTQKTVPALIVMMIAGLAVVLVSGHFAIESVSELAVRIGIPQIVIAATLVALGTSLPELVVGFTAIRKGHPELLVGNVIGADILNILFVTGAAASAAPLPIVDATAKFPEIFLYLHLPAMLLILVYFRICIFSATRTGSFRRWMGIPLVLMYFTYVIAQFAISI